MVGNAYDQYKSQSLSTLAQGELLVKLFDELIKQCRLAEICFDQGKKGVEHDALIKAQTIISALAASLDDRYPISKELKDLYIFFAQELRDANLQKDVNKVKAVLPMLKDLRNTFEQADKISRTKQHAVAGGQAI
ncbi:MAG: flagellar export chaperone FliS [Oscillospiraceae bacterium]|nr:flagellar export chaperone FliS [Oscillospiraceae bacterium]